MVLVVINGLIFIKHLVLCTCSLWSGAFYHAKKKIDCCHDCSTVSLIYARKENKESFELKEVFCDSLLYFTFFNVWLFCGKMWDIFPFSFQINLPYTRRPKGLCWFLKEAIFPSQMDNFLFSGLSCFPRDKILSACSSHSPPLQEANVRMAQLIRTRGILGRHPVTASCLHLKKSKSM